MSSLRVRVGLVLALTLVVHITLLSRLRIDNVRPDALLLVAVVAGLVAGAERGAIVGFSAGLLADLFLQTPFGLSALAYSLVGFAIGSMQSGILRAAWWIPVVTAAAASAAGVVVYALVASGVGQAGMLTGRIWAIIGVVALLNGVLSAALLPVLRWALASGAQPRAFAS